MFLSLAARAQLSWDDEHATAHQLSDEPLHLLNSFGRLQEKTLVIIIDDIGHHLAPGQAAIDLPWKLNIAVLPYTPHGKTLAEKAHRSGKEIMLHAPMSTIGSIPLGRGGLTNELTEPEFRTTLAESLKQIPHVRGINNHMGSDLTQRRRQMSWVMDELQKRELYFVDSRTSHESVAANTAQSFGVPNLTRQVFLDNERSPQEIDKRFREVLDLVNNQGMAVAIGHPYPETIRYLKVILPQLEARGIRLAYVSELFPPKDGNYSLTSTPAADI